jgi:hypothetical protein
MDLAMDLSVSSIAWGDSNGAILAGAGNIGGFAANTGWVGLTNLDAKGIRIQLRTDLINTAFLGHDMGDGTTTLQAATIGTKSAGIQAIFQYYYTTVHSVPAKAGYTWAANAAAIMSDVEFATAASSGALAPAGLDAAAWGSFVFIYHDGVMISIADGASNSLAIQPLTIDVATGAPHGTQTFVRIGLGSLQISMVSMTADVKTSNVSSLANNNVGDLTVAGPATAGGGNSLGNTLGSIYLAGLDMYVNGGSYVDIYARSATEQGVVLGLNVTIDKLNINTLAWGDSDGIQGTTSEGWVGLTGLKITNLTIIGTVGIDVATPTTGQTYVNIGFGSGGLAVGVGGLDANVALGHANTDLHEVLGSIYLSSLTATITGNVQFSAPATGSGVIIDLKSLTVNVSSGFTVSWGDTGFGADGAGFVGMTGVTIGTMVINGKVTIDVATLDSSTTLVTGTRSLMYAGYPTHNLSRSFVHIGLGAGNADSGTTGDVLSLNIGSFGANVVLAGNKALSAGAGTGTLGMVYGAGINAKMNGWVDIAAH